MGIQNRDWYKSNAGGGWGSDWGLYSLTPVVKYIIIANVVVFVLQCVFMREVRTSRLEMIRQYDPNLNKLLEKYKDDPEKLQELRKKNPQLDAVLNSQEYDDLVEATQKVSVVTEWGELDTKKVVYKGQVWRLLTHAFCHDWRGGIWHIFFNMLILYWFGCTIEAMYGSREFLLFYLTAALIAALAFVGLDLWTGSSSPGIGASGAVMAVAMLYAVHYPRETIRIFWFFPIEMRWIMLFYVLVDLHPVLLALAGEQMFTGIAHAAHVGGLAFGFVYGKSSWRLEWALERLPGIPRRPQKRWPRLRIAPETRPVSEPDREMDRVDELLRKISESGQASLTEEERALLLKASERLRKSPR